jgi:hypothetical protein
MPKLSIRCCGHPRVHTFMIYMYTSTFLIHTTFVFSRSTFEPDRLCQDEKNVSKPPIAQLHTSAHCTHVHTITHTHIIQGDQIGENFRFLGDSLLCAVL